MQCDLQCDDDLSFLFRERLYSTSCVRHSPLHSARAARSAIKSLDQSAFIRFAHAPPRTLNSFRFGHRTQLEKFLLGREALQHKLRAAFASPLGSLCSLSDQKYRAVGFHSLRSCASANAELVPLRTPNATREVLVRKRGFTAQVACGIRLSTRLALLAQRSRA